MTVAEWPGLDRAHMQRAGQLGGRAKAARMTKEERRAHARAMALARWAKWRAQRKHPNGRGSL